MVLVDKPHGLTSHDVVSRARRALDIRRVGHSGTLDPMATGLLVLGVGWAARLLRFTDTAAKTYEAEVTLGVETDTWDADGDTIRTAAEAVRSHRLRSALTMLGILIGITAVILTVGIGNGAKADVRDQIDELGTNLLVISPGSSTSSAGVRGGFGSASTLTTADASMSGLVICMSLRRSSINSVRDLVTAGSPAAPTGSAEAPGGCSMRIM